jgi:hypothetical protein
VIHSYRSDDFPSELRHSVAFASRISAIEADEFHVRPATLGDFIGNIIRISPDKQVRRVTAWRVIAFVADNHAAGDWTKG